MSWRPTHVWLCPTHKGEFWVPHGGRCPDPYCEHELAEYVPADGPERELLRRILSSIEDETIDLPEVEAAIEEDIRETLTRMGSDHG